MSRKSAVPRRAALLGAVLTLVAGAVGGCGQAGEADGSAGTAPGKGGLKVGLLFPENQTARYEKYDRPLLTQRIKQLCEDCTVDYANAQNSVATQQQQVDTMITEGVDVLVLNAVSTKALRSSVTEARNAGIPVVAYDRLAEGPVSAFTGYDVAKIGRLQGKALLDAMGEDARGARVVRVQGPADNKVNPYEQGGRQVLAGKVKSVKTYYAAAWNPETSYAAMSGAIAALGVGNIDGVWADNDAVAVGVISALDDARVNPLPPVVGQDADLSAVQRIVAGKQYMTVYKPFKPEAEAAAELALAVGRGERPGELAAGRVSTATTEDIPAALLTPKPLTAQDIVDTVVKDGAYSTGQICTPKYRAACARAGLVE